MHLSFRFRYSLIPLLLVALGTSTFGREVTYRYFRFDPQQMRGDGAENSVQLAEFEVRLNGVTIPGATASNPGGDNPNGDPNGNPFIQTPDRAVDDDLGTKWLDFNKQPLVLDFGQPVTIDAIRFATAGDEPSRDPVAWTFSGSDDGTNWQPLLVEGYDPPPLDRNTFTEAYPIPEPLDILNRRDDIEVIAAPGDPLPGVDANVLGINRGHINNSGQVLLQSTFDYDGGESPNASALLRWQNGASEAIAVEDDIGADEQFFIEAVDGRMNDAGDVIVFTRNEDTLDPIDEYDNTEDERVVRVDGADLTQRTGLIREGRTEAPPGSGYTLRSLVGAVTDFNNRPLLTSYHITADGGVVFAGESENNGGDLVGGIHLATPSGLTTVVAEGDPTPLPGTNFTFIQTDVTEADGITDINDSGQIAFIATFEGTGVDDSDDEGVFLYTPGNGITLLARADDDVSTGEGFEDPYAAELTDDGRVFFQAANARSLEREIWGDPDGDGVFEPIIRKGTEVPVELGYGSNAEFGEPSVAVVTDSGRIFFTCDVFEVTQLDESFLSRALFEWENGEVTRELLDEETEFPALDDATVSWFNLLANRNGDVVLDGRPPGPIDQAVIAIPNGGQPQVLFTDESYVGGLNPGGDTVVEIVGLDLEGPANPNFSNTNYSLLNDNGELLVFANLGSGGNALLQATLEAASPPVRIPAFSLDREANTFDLDLSGQPGASLTLQSTPTLGSGWTDRQTVTLDSEGSASVSTSVDPETDQLFLRAVTVSENP